MKRFVSTLSVLGAAVFLLTAHHSAQAATTCTFTTIGNTMQLDSSCTTDETIVVPDGMTLDGNGHTITVQDPAGGFTGGVIENGGDEAHVRHVTIDAGNLAASCKSGADRLRGILFDGASGSIEYNTIEALNKGASGCQEGNGIEVRNAPFDGTHPDTRTVSIRNNGVFNWQKTGIVANGDVAVTVQQNRVGESATEDSLAANGIQLGFGAGGTVARNNVAGHQWCGPSTFAATGILLFLAEDGTVVEHNNVRGNADVGLYVFSDNSRAENNKIFDEDRMEADCNVSGFDWGIFNAGTNNVFVRNKISGFDLKVANVDNNAPNKQNMVIPGGPKALSDPNLSHEVSPVE